MAEKTESEQAPDPDALRQIVSVNAKVPHLVTKSDELLDPKQVTGLHADR
jgi:hypothetical protein